MPNTNEPVCYLLHPPGTPIPLSRTREMTIGRDISNRITLPYHDVSRFHAKIYWDTQRFIINDLDSANGTRINGQIIKADELKDGDQIAIAEHVLFFYEGEPPIVSAANTSGDSIKETMKINLHDSVRFKLKQASFRGDLKSLNIHSILQVLATDQKTGCMTIYVKQTTARIYLNAGLVVHTEWNSISGIDAFFALMTLVEGAFDFSETSSPKQITMNHIVEFLLLEYARKVDERSKKL